VVKVGVVVNKLENVSKPHKFSLIIGDCFFI
jgi:hypothetical protein